ncbi:MAG: SGNH/GDSL hydrolase family protein [Clostridia bacterium]|nr:SGNH/GDSL hydrolase family protein [Clostridia bacterium]
MTLTEFYNTYSSDCTAGSANQVLTRDEAPVTRCGRIYYRLSHGGKHYSLLFSNQIDSTYADGSISRANDIGGDWDILSLRVGLVSERGTEPDVWHVVTFDGCAQKYVSAGDATPFFCDPIPLHATGGEYLCYEITVCGFCYPYHEEMTLNVVIRDGDTWTPCKKIPAPLMIGSDRVVSRRIGFLGDSITQGCGTEYDSYTHWAAKIAEGLPADYSVWDLGIGYARAYDAATDCGWLDRVKMCDTVNVCMGVNDLLRGRTGEEVVADLTTIVRALKNAGCRVILFTVPPFDMTGDAKDYWYFVNDKIRHTIIKEADTVFDFAAVLGQDAPNAHLSVHGGHPNAEGCAIAAKAYLAVNLI